MIGESVHRIKARDETFPRTTAVPRRGPRVPGCVGILSPRLKNDFWLALSDDDSRSATFAIGGKATDMVCVTMRCDYGDQLPFTSFLDVICDPPHVH